MSLKKIIICICIFFAVKINASALNFSEASFSASYTEKINYGKNFSKLSLNHSSSTNDSDDELDELIFDLLLLGLILIGVTYYVGNTVEFSDYPYQDMEDGSYIKRGDFETLSYGSAGYNKSRFSIDSSLVCIKDMGFGVESRLEGLLFPYIGPYFENLVLFSPENGDFDFNQKGWKDNLKLGGQLSLFQSNLISAYFLLAYTKWFNQDIKNYDSGYCLGFILRSYVPVGPLILEWNFKWQNFSDDFQIFESNIQAGICRNKYEFFAAWKVLSFSNTDDDIGCHFGNFHGFTLGSRMYFSL